MHPLHVQLCTHSPICSVHKHAHTRANTHPSASEMPTHSPAANLCLAPGPHHTFSCRKSCVGLTTFPSQHVSSSSPKPGRLQPTTAKMSLPCTGFRRFRTRVPSLCWAAGLVGAGSSSMGGIWGVSVCKQGRNGRVRDKRMVRGSRVFLQQLILAPVAAFLLLVPGRQQAQRCVNGSVRVGAHGRPCVQGRIHLHGCAWTDLCAWMDPCMHGWIHMCTSRSICMGVHEGIRECTDRSMCRGVHEQIHLGMDLGTEKPLVLRCRACKKPHLLLWGFSCLLPVCLQATGNN